MRSLVVRVPLLGQHFSLSQKLSDDEERAIEQVSVIAEAWNANLTGSEPHRLAVWHVEQGV